jgi:hypothetical protein
MLLHTICRRVLRFTHRSHPSRCSNVQQYSSNREVIGLHTQPRRHLIAAVSIVYTTEIATESELLLEETQTISAVIKINYIIIETPQGT